MQSSAPQPVLRENVAVFGKHFLSGFFLFANTPGGAGGWPPESSVVLGAGANAFSGCAAQERSIAASRRRVHADMALMTDMPRIWRASDQGQDWPSATRQSFRILTR